VLAVGGEAIYLLGVDDEPLVHFLPVKVGSAYRPASIVHPVDVPASTATPAPPVVPAKSLWCIPDPSGWLLRQCHARTRRPPHGCVLRAEARPVGDRRRFDGDGIGATPSLVG
jgi:hypothetical protein